MSIIRITLTTLLLTAGFPVLAAEPAALPPPPDEPAIMALPAEPGAAPTVTIRKIDNGDVVEEYRQDGRLTSIRVKPARGPAYTVQDTNGDGRLDRKDMEGPVAPVYWTLYEWD